METRPALISGLIVLGLLTIASGTLSWIFSILTRLNMPVQAYVIVTGVLTVSFASLAARMFSNE